MKPELRSLWSPDLDDQQLPDELEAQVYVHAVIGAAGSPGADSFSFVVTTPSALAGMGLPRWGHGLLLVENFDWSTVRLAIEKVLRHCESDDWEGVAAKLGRYTDWEFDDYTPYAGG